MSANASADTVTLDNGQTLEGRVTDDGKVVTIQLAQGVVKVPKARVRAITAKVTPLDEYAQRAQDLRDAVKKNKLEPQAEGDLWFDLGKWADEQQLPLARDEAYRTAIEKNPDQAGARAALGYVLYNSRWLTKAQRNIEMGMVRVDGKWVPREAQQEARKAKEDREADDRRQQERGEQNSRARSNPPPRRYEAPADRKPGGETVEPYSPRSSQLPVRSGTTPLWTGPVEYPGPILTPSGTPVNALQYVPMNR
ncbi:MAG TPA: hypothetical protein VGP72_09170 [Planctomycetota bacterium]